MGAEAGRDPAPLEMIPPNQRSSFERVASRLFWVLAALVTALKLVLIVLGPDYDGDAYAHAMAGRLMLASPIDVRIHWVWLPLLHGIHAVATWARAGMDGVRVLNALASTASAAVLVQLLRSRKPASAPDLVPWLGGMLLLLDPLCLWLGITGQTELLFQLFILGGCLSADRKKYLLAGVCFAAASLTRYEVWPVLGVLLLLALTESRGRLLGGNADVKSRLPSLLPHLMWILPALTVAAWCLVQYRATGVPLQFLDSNREFVRSYFSEVGYSWGREPNLLRMATFYVNTVPRLSMLGPVFILAFVGLARSIRELPRGFLAVSATLVAVVTLGFVRGTHLGLSRHAVVFAPFYAALVAQGVAVLAAWLARRFPRLTLEWWRHLALGAVVVLVLSTRTAPRALTLLVYANEPFAAQAAAGRMVRKLVQPNESICCDDNKIEILSRLPPERFFRWQIPDIRLEHVAMLAKSSGSVLVVGIEGRSAHLAGGEVLWKEGDMTIRRFQVDKGTLSPLRSESLGSPTVTPAP